MIKAPTQKGIFLCLGCLLMLVFFLGACAPGRIYFPPAMAVTFPSDVLENNPVASWWACRFKISWPPDTEVDWAVDLLLAHSVIEPVLKKHSKQIYWWRFHRRAARDDVGHQFSFLFYSNSSVSAIIMEDIKQSTILQQALADKIVEKITFDDPNILLHPQIEAMSDHRWAPEIQRNWPSYIMGVSSLWLGLIDDLMQDVYPQDENIYQLLEQYRLVKDRITTLWHDEGQHAFLHHLNAIFGYEALMIKKEVRF